MNLSHIKNRKEISVQPAGVGAGSYKPKRHFGASYLVYIMFGYNLLPLAGWRRGVVVGACVCVAVTAAGHVLLNYTMSNWFLQFLCVLLEYCALVSESCRAPVDYLVNDARLDPRLGFGEKHYRKLKRLHDCLVTFCLTERIVAVSIMCWHEPQHCREEFNADFLFTAVDLYQIPRIVFFASIYYRLELLKAATAAALMGASREDARRRRLRDLAQLYRRLLDRADRASSRINPMMMLSLVCSVPKILCFVYRMMWYLRNDAVNDGLYITIFLTCVSVLDVMQWLLPSAPGLFVSASDVQLQQIKLLLMHYILGNPDEEERKESELFLRYIELRPYRWCVWRVVELDAGLPLRVLQLVTTHLIVAVQFSNLYH